MEGRSRGRLTVAITASAVALVGACVIARASVGLPEQQGVFALLGGTPKIVSRLSAEPGAGSTYILKIRQFHLDGRTPILKYDIDMQKLIHLIIVRDDFTTFAHVHPVFDAATGTFLQRFTPEPNHQYFVYADTVPHDIGEQVFRFTIGVRVGETSLVGFQSRTSSVPPYTVTLSRTALVANQAQTIEITVTEAGRPAPNLAPYLGAAAHAVFISVSTHAYVHLHPTVRGAQNQASGSMNMDMSGAAGPFMQMNVPSLPAGTYKLWIEFSGASGKVYDAPFTLLVR